MRVEAVGIDYFSTGAYMCELYEVGIGIFIIGILDVNLECTVDPGWVEIVKMSAQGLYFGSGVFLASWTRIGVYESFCVCIIT